MAWMIIGCVLFLALGAMLDAIDESTKENKRMKEVRNELWDLGVLARLNKCKTTDDYRVALLDYGKKDQTK